MRVISTGIHGNDLAGGGQGILLDVLKHGVELLGAFDLLQEVVHLRTLICKMNRTVMVWFVHSVVKGTFSVFDIGGGGGERIKFRKVCKLSVIRDNIM